MSRIEHTADMTIARAAFNVYAAKRSAELSIGVGCATDVAIVSQSGITFLAARAMRSLEEAYAATTKRNAPSRRELASIEKHLPRPRPGK